jgi:hypothetical protein
MLSNSRVNALAAMLFALTPMAALAADVRLNRNTAGEPVILFDGKIVEGDAGRVSAILGQTGVAGIRLNSNGGNVGEAIEVAAALGAAKVPAIVMEGRVCASACFLLFMCSPERHAHVNAQIGVHGTSEAGGDAKGKESVMSFAVDTVLARIAAQCGAPKHIIAAMVTTPADSMYWLTTQDLFASGAHVWNNGEITQGETAQGAAPRAPQLPPPPPARGGEEANRPVTLTDLHLRAAPDPRAADVLGPPPNDYIPRGTQIRITGSCQVWTGSGRGAQDADNVWCPAVYGAYRGWVNGWYLGTSSAGAGRFACVYYPAARGC